MGAEGTEDDAGGRARWRADLPDDDDSLGTLWIRWTDGGTDLHLHRICAIVPQIGFQRAPPFVCLRDERGDRPTFERVERAEDGTYRETGEEVKFEFIDGVPRQLLRHTPLVVLVAMVLLLVGAEFTPGVGGISDLVPSIMGPDAALFGLYLCITPVLLWLLSSVGVVEYYEFPTAAVVYGQIAALASGVAVTLFLVTTADHPSAVDANVVFVSGYLLLLLIAGQFLYEASLRIEHLFVKLASRNNDIVGREVPYRHFLTDLNDSLRRSMSVLRPSRVFGVLIAAQFAIIWIIGEGPQHLNFTPGLVVNVVFNAVLGTVTFQFLVVVRYFNRLLNADEEYTDVELTYEPFHVDGYGGFRDLGRFATRMNVILSMAGIYLVYRLYVVGARSIPPEGVMALGAEDPLLLAVWLISFVGPVLGYALGAAAWLYYSFWTMHVKMVRDKHRIVREYQGASGDAGEARTPAAGDLIAEFEGTAGPEWGALQDAPTWPLEVNKMVSLVTGYAVPLMVPASGVLF